MKKSLSKRWDVFICYASEDKNEVARPLADEITSHGLKVWYDEFSLELGDSLRETIDRGLAKSDYGVIIISQNFFRKKWPQMELNGLVTREVSSKRKIILPIWHKVDEKDVAKFSLLLADRYAAKTSEGMNVVVDKIVRIIKKPKNEVVEPPIDVTEKLVNQDFKGFFSSKLASLANLLKSKLYNSEETNDLIDVLIMLFKGRIEEWDVPSVRFATRELFTNLYEFSEKDGRLCELYTIFTDLFSYAYSQRKQLIASMIETLNSILLRSWTANDVERGEKAAKILLRLGIDFLDKDLGVSYDCFTSIDNLAGDMFKPEILSKEILLGASAFRKIAENPELKDFVEKIVDWIRINDQYAWDADIKTYLRDSIKYAKGEQKKYDINVEPFEQKYLLPALEQNIDEQIKSYVEFLSETASEGDKDIQFPAEELARMILAYEFLRPKIANEIRELVIKTKNLHMMRLFSNIVHNNNFLIKIYEGSDMITTFDELVKFFETCSDMENSGVGITAYSLAMIDFKKKLKEEEKEALEKIVQKYGLKEEMETTDQGIIFEIDHLVYVGHDQHNMRKLVDFLREINNIFGVESFSTGITFKLREI